MLNKRENATVLAALRHWQRHRGDARADEIEIATDGETLEALSLAEIDTLCEKINAPPPTPIREAAIVTPKFSKEQIASIQKMLHEGAALQIIKVAPATITQMACVGIFLEGGLVRGVRSNVTPMEFVIYDADNQEQPSEEDKEQAANDLLRYESLPHAIY